MNTQPTLQINARFSTVGNISTLAALGIRTSKSVLRKRAH